jgi:hypothetical protein
MTGAEREESSALHDAALLQAFVQFAVETARLLLVEPRCDVV